MYATITEKKTRGGRAGEQGQHADAEPKETRGKGGMPDAEAITKMAELDYMGPVQVEFFRDVLLHMREELCAKNIEGTCNLLADVGADIVDRASAEEGHALVMTAQIRDRKLLAEIDAALTRLRNGEFGWCEETGEAIGVGRLIAYPTARLTIEAQQRLEVRSRYLLQ